MADRHGLQRSISATVNVHCQVAKLMPNAAHSATKAIELCIQSIEFAFRNVGMRASPIVRKVSATSGRRILTVIDEPLVSLQCSELAGQ